MGIADAALNLGHKVTFFSSTFRHSTKKQRFDKTTKISINENYDLVFVKSPSYNNHISLKRIWAHYKLGLNLMNEIKNIDRLPDAILVAIPTLSSALNISKWAKDREIPVFIDIIDPWPDSFFLLYKDWRQIFLKLVLLPMSFRIRQILKHVNGAVAISNAYCQWAESISPKKINTKAFYPSVNFSEIQKKQYDLKLQQKKTPNNDLHLIYAGSFAISYDIPCILDSAKILFKKYGTKINFHFAGNGFYKNDILKYEANYPNIIYHGLLNSDELQNVFSNCDIGLIQHFGKASQTVTYKLFDYLSAGLVVVNSLDSEMKELIIANEIGLNHSSSNTLELVHCIEYFYNKPLILNKFKENAINFCRENGNSELVYSKLINYLLSD